MLDPNWIQLCFYIYRCFEGQSLKRLHDELLLVMALETIV
jgi:hypothetical protein